MIDDHVAARWTPTEIRYCRKAVGMRQAELAVRLGVSRQTVNNWESGRVTPTRNNLERLHRVLSDALTSKNARRALLLQKGT